MKNMKELNEFLSEIIFSYTHRGGLKYFQDIDFNPDFVVDGLDIFVNVELQCNGCSLQDFESKIRNYKLAIQEEVFSDISILPKLSMEIENLKSLLFDMNGKFNRGVAKYKTVNPTTSEYTSHTIELPEPDEEELSNYYSTMIFNKLKKDFNGLSTDIFIKSKVDYQQLNTQDSFRDVIISSISALEEWIDKNKYLFEKNGQFNNTQSKNDFEKIKWVKNQNALAYLISNLHFEGYIKLPSNGNEIHYSKVVELIMNTFSFNKEKVNIDRFTREFNMKSNSYKIKPNDPLLKLLEMLNKFSD